MAATTLAADFMNKFEQPITSYIDSTAATVASNLSGPITLGAIIYIVLFGMMIATGRVQGSASEFLWSCLKIAVIVILVTKPETYKYYVSDFFFRTIPDELGGLLTQAGDSIGSDIKSGSAFDNVIDRSYMLGMKIVEGASWDEFATIFFGYTFIIVATIIMVLIFMIVLFAKVGLALMIAVGPIFIAMALFDATRSYTSSWVAMISNFAILQVLIFALYGLLLSLISSTTDAASALSGAGAFSAAINGLGTFVLALVVASQLPGIASSLAGSGIALGSSVMGSVMSATRAGSRFVGRKTVQGVGKTLSAGWNATKRAVQGVNTVGKG